MGEESPERETSEELPKEEACLFNGKETMVFEEFIDLINDSCKEKEAADNYLVHAFSMFDRTK